MHTNCVSSGKFCAVSDTPNLKSCLGCIRSCWFITKSTYFTYIYICVYIDLHFIVIAFWRVIAVSSVSSVTLSVVAVDFTRYTYRRAIR